MKKHFLLRCAVVSALGLLFCTSLFAQQPQFGGQPQGNRPQGQQGQRPRRNGAAQGQPGQGFGGQMPGGFGGQMPGQGFGGMGGFGGQQGQQGGMRRQNNGAPTVAPSVLTAIPNRAIFPDTTGTHINAHGGCMLYQDGTYFWYGEHRAAQSFQGMRYGVHLYTSKDLYNWEDKGLVFETTDGSVKELQPGRSIIERPKVVYNEKTKKYVLWFHAETQNNYDSASLGVATSDSPYGPFKFLRVSRPEVKSWPQNVPDDLKNYVAGTTTEYNRNKYRRLVPDFEKGQDSRDMTVFVDEDKKAYVIHSSEMNATLHIVQLDDTYTEFTDTWWRIFIDGSMEAPVMFREKGKYYLIGSYCTGWNPNEARIAVADHIYGPWKELGNPAVDEGGKRTYEGQSAHMFTIPAHDGVPEEKIIMFDIWKPNALITSQYMWLKLEWEGEKPVLHYTDKLVFGKGAANAAAVKPATNDKYGAGYLFAHFRGERGNEYEQIYFAVSKDGLNWQSLNGAKKVLVSDVGEKGVRDPFLVRDPKTGKIYLIATDLCIGLNGDWNRAQTTGSKAIIVWESMDLVNWSAPRRVEIAADNAGCTWAPEAIWDSKQNNFLVFWASMATIDNKRQQRIYSCRTSDFRTFTKPQIYIARDHSVIDTTIVQDADGVYYRFTKNETTKHLFMEYATELEGTWTLVRDFTDFNGFEGPECFKLNDGSGRWILIADHFYGSDRYQPYVTDKLSSGKFVHREFKFDGPYRFHHGGVLPISQQEYDALLKKWGPSAQ